MLARLASFRLRLLASMVIVGIAGLVGAYVLVSAINHADENSADRAKALIVAQRVGLVVQSGAERDDLAAIQQTLPDDRILVYRGGALIYGGPLRPRPLELTVTAPYPGGRVVLEDHESRIRAPGLTAVQLILIAAGVIGLVIVAALVVVTYVVRALSLPIEHATDAARRVAAGDLSARIGQVEQGEFAELGSTFDDMVQRLEDSDRDQRRFLGDVAHEIATPVNAIRGFATALADGTMSTGADGAEAVALIESQGRRIDALLDDLRHLTRLDLTQTVGAERIDLGGLLADLVRRFAATAANAGIELRIDEPLPSATFESDRRLIETVLDNFLSNAIRYTGSGGSVTVSARADPAAIAIAVRDTGIGIAPEHQRRVFERLYRVDEARDRASGGSGLGLAIAQRAARAIGGHIELSSQPGSGSEFRLVVPTVLR